MSDQLYNLEMFVPVQEGEDEYYNYKSPGFDEQADPCNHGDDAATWTASMSDQLYNLEMFVPVQEGEDEYYNYKSPGFDEQADPCWWDRFLLEDELPPCAPPPAAASQPAETAVQGPCPEEREKHELKINGLPWA
ncbi:hypothetical protein GUJ93_ZPchr0008g13263 [Zizania palustris]|uniref:Uncharacterized protein n=1 Tax=Zizania palustris TaxID=103762 RepID=A0A8J5UVT5_ZIZPA|nr:hypothetical protein GUJ93_ZPchr0008g13263 [Zizania palustris]